MNTHAKIRRRKFPKTIHRRLWWSTVDARLTNSNGILDELTHCSCAMVHHAAHIQHDIRMAFGTPHSSADAAQRCGAKAEHSKTTRKKTNQPIKESTTLLNDVSDRGAWAKNAVLSSWSDHTLSEIMGFELNSTEKRQNGSNWGFDSYLTCVSSK